STRDSTSFSSRPCCGRFRPTSPTEPKDQSRGPGAAAEPRDKDDRPPRCVGPGGLPGRVVEDAVVGRGHEGGAVRGEPSDLAARLPSGNQLSPPSRLASTPSRLVAAKSRPSPVAVTLTTCACPPPCPIPLIVDVAQRVPSK